MTLLDEHRLRREMELEREERRMEMEERAREVAERLDLPHVFFYFFKLFAVKF